MSLKVFKSTLDQIVGNHEGRIRLLERIRSGGWIFDFLNIGGYGYVQTGDCVDLDLTPDPLAIGGTMGLYMADDSGCGAAFGSNTGGVIVKSRDGQTRIEAGTSPLTFVVNGQAFFLKDDGTIELPSGAIIGP